MLEFITLNIPENIYQCEICKVHNFHVNCIFTNQTYLSTSVLMTANVSSTRPSTFCFFRLGSWGPRPRRGGLTGSLGRLLRASTVSTPVPVPWSSLRACPRVPLDEPWWWSSKSLSSRQTQLLPIVPALETTATRVSKNGGRWFEERKSRTRARLLQAQKVIQAATIISFVELGFGGFLPQWAGSDWHKWSYCCRVGIGLRVVLYSCSNRPDGILYCNKKSSEHHGQVQISCRAGTAVEATQTEQKK